MSALQKYNGGTILWMIWMPSLLINVLLISFYPEASFEGLSGTLLLMEHLIMGFIPVIFTIIIWEWKILSAFQKQLSRFMSIVVIIAKVLMLLTLLYVGTFYLIWICWKLKIDIFNLNDVKLSISRAMIHDLNIFLNVYSLAVLIIFKLITAKVLRTIERCENSFIYHYFGTFLLLLFAFLGGCFVVQARVKNARSGTENSE